MAEQDKVRPSRDGDQFHYHWAARQCLELLPGTGDLVAVSIEGSSTEETDSGEKRLGNEVIDVGLYYGSEAIKDARLIRYVQLKHSSRQASTAWTVSGLKTTIRGFANRYSGLLAHTPAASLVGRVQFEFTTNRPIDSKLQEVLADIASGAKPRHLKEHEAINRYSGLDHAIARDFFALFSAVGCQPNLWATRNLLTQDLGMYLANADYEAPAQLKELVTRKATTEYELDPVIRQIDVLRALKTSEESLLPAPCLLTNNKATLPREQEEEIRQAFLTAEKPLIIHADGGVGKSVLASRLASSMPHGSETVLYDCFGNGLYRSSLGPRHRHRDALVQISNELAARGLCHPLLPSTNADTSDYLRALSGRLTQAIGTLRANNPEANLCLIIDAADNAEMAAEERKETSFVRDLIRMEFPEGVRVAFTCRTHRRDRLAAPPDTVQIELRSFSRAETGLHLRTAYPDATETETAQFDFLSSSNPRVQAFALDSGLPISEMLKDLGSSPTTVDQAIGDLLNRAISNLKDLSGNIESAQIDLICQGLAVLRPLVPIDVLARISGSTESAIRSFAIDLRRPLIVKGNSLHFLDEPSETWFREKFQPDEAGMRSFLERLRPLAEQSAYAASAIPQLLLRTGQLHELVKLALSGNELPTKNPLERRDVEMQRLVFALKACLGEGMFLDAAKLAFKAGGESAGESRQIKLIQENTDLAAALLASDRISEIVSRRTFASSWMGSHHVYDAGLLSGCKEFEPEATISLRMAMDWFYSWSQQTGDTSQRQNVDDADRAEIAMAKLRLHGAENAVVFLRIWIDRRYAFTSTKLLARRLIDLGRVDQLDALATAAGNNVWILLALAVEARAVGCDLPAKPLARLLRLLCDRRVKLPESSDWNANWDILDAVQASITMALRVLPPAPDTWEAMLSRYLPEQPPKVFLDQFRFKDISLLLRAYALQAALRGHVLTLIEIAPENVRTQLESRSSHSRSQEANRFEREVGGLLPWFVLGGEVSCGRVPSDLSARIDTAKMAVTTAENNDYQRFYRPRQTAAQEWLRILRDADAQGAETGLLVEWIENLETPLWTSTLTTMCRSSARREALQPLALALAGSAYSSLEDSRDTDVESRLGEYQELSRAVFPISKSEATAYFNRAIEIASRVGEEHFNLWAALLHVAKAASDINHPKPKTAYLLARAAETTYVYVAQDSYFEWRGTVEVLTGLCGTSALAILSRWRDRQFGDSRRIFPVAIYGLVKRGLLPPSAPLALAGLVAEWDRFNDLQSALATENRGDLRSLMLQASYRYLRLTNQPKATWEGLAHLGETLGVELLDIGRLRHAYVVEVDRSNLVSKIFSSNHEGKVRRTPDWDHYFDGIDMSDFGALRKSYADLRTYDGPYELREFFQHGFRVAGIGKESDFISAVSSWPDFGIFDLARMLECIPTFASTMISVQAAVRSAVLVACRHEPQLVRRTGWNVSLPFGRLHDGDIVLDEEVVKATIEGFALQADTLDSRSLFQMLDPLATCLTPDEAEEALCYGLDLIEGELRPDDGDGPWHNKLIPTGDCMEALAGYVWAGLGSPTVADRWEFAHVVRTCVELGWSDFLTALHRWSASISTIPFADARLEFYNWHAKQWLLIGLARAAEEHPSHVSIFTPFLQSSLTEEHVLIRELAARSIRKVQRSLSKEPTEAAMLDNVNAPSLPLSTHWDWGESNSDELTEQNPPSSDGERYYFGIDIGPYWFAPLGSVFGLSETSITTRVRIVLRERLGVEDDWRTDPRHQRKVFTDFNKTLHSGGTLPETDDLAAYRSYHAMMIVAARLLASHAVRQETNEEANLYQGWIDEYALTRPDKKWLSDRRDPCFIIAPAPPTNYRDETWCRNITTEYLDAQLITDDDQHVLWGSWSTGTDSDHTRETVSIRSSLVSKTGALSLVTALQTATDPDRFFLPDANPEDAIRAGHLTLTGWVTTGNKSAGLDRQDPWAAEVQFPAPRPHPEIIEKLVLQPSSDGRFWTNTTDSPSRLRSESWSQTINSYGNETTDDGTRLSGNLEFVRQLLNEHAHDCLIVSVSVRRYPPQTGNDFGSYPAPVVRYYLMENDGIPRTL